MLYGETLFSCTSYYYRAAKLDPAWLEPAMYCATQCATSSGSLLWTSVSPAWWHANASTFKSLGQIECDTGVGFIICLIR